MKSQVSGVLDEPDLSDLGALREAGLLCDVELEAGDGTRVEAHQVVLAAASPYFRSLFAGAGAELDAAAAAEGGIGSRKGEKRPCRQAEGGRALPSPPKLGPGRAGGEWWSSSGGVARPARAEAPRPARVARLPDLDGPTLRLVVSQLYGGARRGTVPRACLDALSAAATFLGAERLRDACAQQAARGLRPAGLEAALRLLERDGGDTAGALAAAVGAAARVLVERAGERPEPWASDAGSGLAPGRDRESVCDDGGEESDSGSEEGTFYPSDGRDRHLLGPSSPSSSSSGGEGGERFDGPYFAWPRGASEGGARQRRRTASASADDAAPPSPGADEGGLAARRARQAAARAREAAEGEAWLAFFSLPAPRLATALRDDGLALSEAGAARAAALWAAADPPTRAHALEPLLTAVRAAPGELEAFLLPAAAGEPAAVSAVKGHARLALSRAAGVPDSALASALGPEAGFPGAPDAVAASPDASLGALAGVSGAQLQRRARQSAGADAGTGDPGALRSPAGLRPRLAASPARGRPARLWVLVGGVDDRWVPRQDAELWVGAESPGGLGSWSGGRPPRPGTGRGDREAPAPEERELDLPTPPHLDAGGFVAGASSDEASFLVGSGAVGSRVWRLTARAPGWEELPRPIAPRRSRQAAAVARGALLILGGDPGAASPRAGAASRAACEAWADDGRGWRGIRAPRSGARESAGAAPLRDGRAALAGGRLVRGRGGRCASRAEAYDPASDAWAWLGAENATPRRYAPLVASPDAGRLLLVGGVDDARERLASCEWLDPRDGRWQAAPALPAPRSSAAAVAVGPHGDVLVAGGHEGSLGRATASACVLDARAWRWRRAPDLAAPRTGCVLLPWFDAP